MKVKSFLLALVVCSGPAGPLSFDSARAQNIVSANSDRFTANPVNLTDAEVNDRVFRFAGTLRMSRSRGTERVAADLEAHVAQFIGGWPWRPLQQTLGISGHEVYFDHPDEMFHALSLAASHLSQPLAARTRAFLEERLRELPPYGIEGFDRRTGRPRESYDVPDKLRVPGRGRARSAFGVYAWWAYCQAADNRAAARDHWATVRQRMQPLLEGDYPFDIRGPGSGKSESQKLNGDLAGLIGLVRLARMNGDGASEKAALSRVRLLMGLRVNLERVNDQILEKSNDATKGLHNFKLARYCDLVPEVGAALLDLGAGCGERRLHRFREERNGWFMAWGDRLIGGENYTNPLHFPRSLFAGAALIENLDARQLGGFIDVPWCPGDFYFIEKRALALWVEAGRPWAQLSGE